VDIATDPRVAAKAWAAAEGLVSAVVAPLIHADTVYGTLAVYTRRPHVFSAAEVSLVASLASLGASAMANARLFAREQARKAEAEALLEIAQAVSSTLELTQLLKIIAKRTAQAIDAVRCSIYLWRDGHLAPVMSQFADGHAEPELWQKFKAMGPYRLEEVPGHAEAIRTRRPVLIDDVLGSNLIPAYWIEAFGLRAVAVIPLISQDEVIGTLNLEQTAGPYAWRPEQVSLAMLIANQAALAVDNARLYTQVQAQLKELQDTQAQLLQAGKLTAVGQLVSGVAHELNNPLSVVIGYGQLLLARGVPPELRGRLELIVSHGERMAKIVQGLLLFSRQGEPERQRVEVRAVIEQIVGLRATQLALSGIQIGTDFGVGVSPVDGDAHQLQQVILNLLLNAEQAILGRGRAGGRCGDHIRVSTSCRSDGGASWVVVQVEDNGPGIPPAILSRIFEPFFTTKPVGDGTGLGLSVSYGIVQQHGGRLSVESAPGRTVFAVELPAATPGAEAPPVALPAPVAGGGRRVLVVDDEPDIVEVITAVLGRHGWRIDIASGGRPALSRLQETCYDLVISDMRMADGSGEELYRAAVAQRPDIAGRFLFITGDTANLDAWQFLRTTQVPVLEKPFTPDGLFKALEGVIGPGSDGLLP